jgi:hypothetical protein
MITWAERAKAAISQGGQSGTAKTDETSVARLFAVSSVPTMAVPAMTERLSSVLTVPSPAVLEKHDSSIAVTEDPDRWCWPHSSAMNGPEIDTFAMRLHKFTDKGLAYKDGEALADKLVLRDREQDDRRLCLECRHLSGCGQSSWRCGNRQAAGIAMRSRDSQLPADLVKQLQRCNGFTAPLKSTPQGTEDEHDRH